MNTQDFSSFLLQAQASKAKIIGLANAGGDTINSIKQAAEFGITKSGQNLAGLLVFLTDVHGAGPADRAGADHDRDVLLGPERQHPRLAQALRGEERRQVSDHGAMPASIGAVLHYLKAVEAGKTDDGTKTVAKMKEMPTDDPVFGKGDDPRRRPQDPSGLPVRGQEAGRVQGPVRLLQAAGTTIPAEQAFRPLADGDCPLAK